MFFWSDLQNGQFLEDQLSKFAYLEILNRRFNKARGVFERLESLFILIYQCVRASDVGAQLDLVIVPPAALCKVPTLQIWELGSSR